MGAGRGNREVGGKKRMEWPARSPLPAGDVEGVASEENSTDVAAIQNFDLTQPIGPLKIITPGGWRGMAGGYTRGGGEIPTMPPVGDMEAAGVKRKWDEIQEYVSSVLTKEAMRRNKAHVQEAWTEEEDMTLRSTIADFAGCVSAHGFSKVYRSQHWGRRLLWLTVCLIMMSWGTYQCHSVIAEYLTYPKKVTIGVEEDQEVEFPAVTVCSLNPLGNEDNFIHHPLWGSFIDIEKDNQDPICDGLDYYDYYDNYDHYFNFDHSLGGLTFPDEHHPDTEEETGPMYGYTTAATGPMYGDTTADTGPMYGDTTADTGPMYGDTTEDTGPMYGDTTADTGPMYGDTTADTGPMYGDTTADTGPMYGDTTADTGPMYGDTTAHTGPMYGDTTADTGPMYGDTTADTGPMYGDTTADTGPMYGDTTADTGPMYGDTTAHTGPMYGDTTAHTGPMYGDTTAHTGPMYGDTTADTGPMYGDTTADTGPMYGDTTADTGPMYGDTTAHTGPMYGDTTADTGPMYGDTTAHTGPMYGDTTADTGPMYGDTTEDTGPMYGDTTAHTGPMYGDTTAETDLMNDATTKPTTEGSVVTQESTTEGSVVTQESTTEGSVVTQESTTKGSVATQESTTEGSVVTQESTTEGSVATQESTTEGSVVTQESTTKGSVATQESTTEGSVVTQESTTEGSVATQESTTEGSVATQESTTEGIVDTQESTTEESVVTQESTTEGSVFTQESTTEGSVVTQESTTEGSVVTQESTTEGSVVTQESTTEGSVATQESTTEGSDVTQESTTEGSVATQESTTEGIVDTQESTTEESVVTQESTTEGSVVTQESATEGSVVTQESTTEGSVVTQESTTEGSVVSQESTTEGSVVTQESTTEGSVVTQESTTEGSVVTQESTTEGSVVTQESTTEGSVVTQESTTEGSVVTQESATEGSVVTQESTTEGSVVTQESTTEGSVVAQESTTEGSVATQESTTEGSVVTQESTTEGSVVTQESTTEGSVATEESTTEGSVVTQESTTEGSVVTQESTTEGSVATQESTTDGSVATQESTTEGSVATQESTTEGSVATQESTTEGSVATRESTTEGSVVTQESTTEGSVATQESTTEGSVATQESTTEGSVAESGVAEDTGQTQRRRRWAISSRTSASGGDFIKPPGTPENPRVTQEGGTREGRGDATVRVRGTWRAEAKSRIKRGGGGGVEKEEEATPKRSWMKRLEDFLQEGLAFFRGKATSTQSTSTERERVVDFETFTKLNADKLLIGTSGNPTLHHRTRRQAPADPPAVNMSMEAVKQLRLRCSFYYKYQTYIKNEESAVKDSTITAENLLKDDCEESEYNVNVSFDFLCQMAVFCDNFGCFDENLQDYKMWEKNNTGARERCSSCSPDCSPVEWYTAWSQGNMTSEQVISIIRKSRTLDFSDLMGTFSPSEEDLTKYSIPARDFIRTCSFDRRPCSHQHFYKWTSDQYGSCYTFNSAFMMVKTKDNRRLNAVPRKTYAIGPTRCQKVCVEREYWRVCQCYVGHNPAFRDPLNPRPTQQCSPFNVTQQMCLTKVQFQYQHRFLQCDCPPACKETVYTTQVTTNEPNQWFYTVIQNLKKTMVASDLCNTNSANETVRLHVYLNSLTHETIQESPAYTWDTLVCNVGGNLGLFIGMSIVTIVELMELMVDVGLLSCRSYRRRHARVTTLNVKQQGLSEVSTQTCQEVQPYPIDHNLFHREARYRNTQATAAFDRIFLGE
ncbi:uncharacterized protein [Panulirus ornatus]|uniref:uncharacterized protein n=1 Tax=Panulirus ornatus TaxID=150431 RepID=UPI003A8ADCF0